MQRLVFLSLLRFLLRSKVSLTMAVLGIGIATASVVSVHLVSVRVEQQLNNLVPGPLQTYNYFLYGPDAAVPISDYAALRREWRGNQYPDVTALTPVIDTRVQLEDRWVRLIGLDLIGMQNADWLDGESSGLEDEREFTWDGAWVDESLAGLQVIPVNGVLDLPLGVVVTDIGRAQALLGWPADEVSYVAARIATQTGSLVQVLDKLLPGFSAGLPQGLTPSVGDWRVVAFDRQHPGIEFGRSVLFNVSALAALSLVVAWFLIYQVALNWLRRLSFVFERLQILGVNARVCLVYYASLLGVVGLVAWALGLALGVAGAQGLLGGIGVATDQVSVDVWLLLKAGGCAVGVAVVSAWSCWHNFFRTASAAGKRMAMATTTVLIVMGLVGAGFAQTGLVGGFVTIAVVALLVAVAIRPLMNWVRGRLHHLGPIAEARFTALHLLATREAFWFPKELSIALAGLILAVGTAIGVGLMVSSFRLDFQAFLDQRLAYDITVDGSEAVLQQSLAALEDQPGVQRIQIYRQTQMRYQGAPIEVRATRFDAFELGRYNVGMDVPDSQVLINEQFAQRYDVGVGDVLSASDIQGRIVGVIQGFGDTSPRLMVDLSHPLARLVGPLSGVSFNSRDPGASAGELGKRVPEATITNATVMKTTAMATFDRTFVITSILTTIALIVASVGLYVGVTSLRLNRRGSSGLLVSLGASFWENLGVDFWRSLIMGLAAVVVAIPLGLLLGWLLCSVINPRAFGWSIQMHADVWAILLPCVWGMLAAVAAGVLRLGSAEEGQVGVGHAT